MRGVETHVEILWKVGDKGGSWSEKVAIGSTLMGFMERASVKEKLGGQNYGVSVDGNAIGDVGSYVFQDADAKRTFAFRAGAGSSKKAPKEEQKTRNDWKGRCEMLMKEKEYLLQEVQRLSAKANLPFGGMGSQNVFAPQGPIMDQKTFNHNGGNLGAAFAETVNQGPGQQTQRQDGNQSPFLRPEGGESSAGTVDVAGLQRQLLAAIDVAKGLSLPNFPDVFTELLKVARMVQESSQIKKK